jgi:hypothetical protein
MLHFRNILLILYCISISHSATSQKVTYPTGLIAYFSLSKSRVSDTNDFYIKVKYKNTQTDTVNVFNELIEGPIKGPYSNLHIEIQRREGRSYKVSATMSYQYFYGDSVFVFKYMNLPPGDSAESRFKVFDFIHYAAKGKYRIKVNLRKVPLPLAQVQYTEYTSSRWLYFEVTKEIINFQKRENK